MNKAVWNTINQGGNIGADKTKSEITHVIADSIKLTDPTEIANALNETFSNIPKTTFEFETTLRLLKNTKPIHPVTNTFYLRPTSPMEVENCINKLKNSDSIDIFELNVEVYILLSNLFSEVIAHMVNASFQEGKVPAVLKTSVVNPVFKTGLKDDPTKYRPVSIIPILAKIVEKVMRNRLTSFFENINMYNNA